MDDQGIRSEITALVEQEHALRQQLQDGEIEVGEEHARLRSLEQELDQCWDLLRQRQARCDAGQDPDDAGVRPVGEVEGYRQ